MFYYRSVLVLCLSCSSIKPRRAPERHCSSRLKKEGLYMFTGHEQFLETIGNWTYLSRCWLRPAWLWISIRSSSSGFSIHPFSAEHHLEKLNSCYCYISISCSSDLKNAIPLHFPYSLLSLETSLSVVHWLVVMFACESVGYLVWGKQCK